MKIYHTEYTCVEITQACVTYKQSLYFCIYVMQICQWTPQASVTSTQVFVRVRKNIYTVIGVNKYPTLI